MESRRQPVTNSHDLTDSNQQLRKNKGHSLMMDTVRSLVYRAISLAHWVVSWIVFIIHRGLEPLSKKDALSLIKVEQQRSPLTNALFCLGSKASERHCPQLWACGQNTQLALLVLAGGGVERFLWRELKMVVYDEVNWTRSLYVLRHTLWPGGNLLKTPNKKLSEVQVEMLKRKAADSFKKFLPSELLLLLLLLLPLFFCLCVFLFFFLIIINSFMHSSSSHPFRFLPSHSRSRRVWPSCCALPGLPKQPKN